MKIGYIFKLPPEYDYPLNHIGIIRDEETQKKLIAKYQVIEVEGEKKGKVIVTYGNKRRH